jgi:2-polyprenyl-3-methyl-5-hydroxy-6-metoxy-1,4-benzoquinol methylase
MTVVEGFAGAGTLLGLTEERLPYAEPEELLAGIRADAPAPEWLELSQSDTHGCRVTELTFRTELLAGRDVLMHGYVCRPSDDVLPPVLLIPGGRGKIDPEVAAWHAARIGCCLLSVDWIGVGGSSQIGLEPPAQHAFRFAGHDVRASYQFHNLRAFVQALDVLLAQPSVDVSRLSVMGNSWGGFYSLLLAGLEPRIRHVRPVFGCGFLELGCHQIWQSHLASMEEEDVEQWRRTFDPGRRAHLIAGDVVYVQATNDRYFGLQGTMRTYHEVASPKRLILARNQDHTAEPFHELGVAAVGRQVHPGLDDLVPYVDAVWRSGAPVVEIWTDAVPERVREVSVAYSGGSYTEWAARPWRTVPAKRAGDRWFAELPIVQPDRELWFYGHVELSNGGAGSSPVWTVVPEDVGAQQRSAAFVPGFDFASEAWWDLPVGDPGDPRMSVVEDDGVTALNVSFLERGSLRGVSFCLEGDLIAEQGYDGIELLLRVPQAEDVAGLKLAVFTDYGTLEEQAYGIAVEKLLGTSGEWQRVSFRFDELEWAPHREYMFFEPQEKPLDVSRLCAIGLLRDDAGYRGEAMLADIRLVMAGDPPAPAPVSPPVPGSYELHLETPLAPEELRAQLRRWEPWRHEVVFGNGVRTSELAQGEMFTARPLEKWHDFESRIPPEALQSGRALDVGSNIGHYSIFLRRTFGMNVTGLETNPRNLEVARFLVQASGLDGIEFLDADASAWREGSGFRLVLHFGTLDHLRHPFAALENAAAMLEPDGYLALELQTLDDPADPYLCRFVGDSDDSTTCCWFLGRGALLRMLEEAGFDRVEVLREWRKPELIGEDMARLVILARRAPWQS